MKACDALIAWTPVYWQGPGRGEIKVGPLPRSDRSDWTKPYAFTGGAAFMNVRELLGAESVARVFVDFNTAVLRDGIDPKAAHEAFLAIDEYAEYISPDIKGSRNPNRF